MDARERNEGRHHRRGSRHGVDEDGPRRGREHKRRHREGDGPSQRYRREYDEQTMRQRSPLKALKLLQEWSGEHAPSTYVQQWLGLVDREDAEIRREHRSSSPSDHLDRGIKQAAIDELQMLHKTNMRPEGHERTSKEVSRHRKRHTSTDSSLLQPVNSSPQMHGRKMPVVEGADDKRPPKAQDDLRKRKYVPNDESNSVSELPQPEGIFNKRRRHKTKEDRYDGKAKRSKVAVEEKVAKKKPKKVRRGDAAKSSRAAGEDLLRSFTSNKIAQERISMRPGTGIFRNGKASSPSRKRGISDLAFSEMDFLSHSKNRPLAVEQEIVTSKHGQKLQRERERTRNEISTYFAPRQPRQVVEPTQQDRRSPVMPSERGATTVASSEFGGTSCFQPESPYRRLPSHKEHYLGFGTNISSPRKFSLPLPPQQPIYVRPSVETERSGSSSTMSYVSWSETENSPSRLDSLARGISMKQPSSRSSSLSVLRRRLIESGMLDGLGLHLGQHLPQEASTHNEQPSTREDVSSQQSSHHRHSILEAGSSSPDSPFNLEARETRQDRPHIPHKLRRQQIEAARRAISSPRLATAQYMREPGAPRNVLASRTYLRPPPSAVPRRPATTTPVRQSSQNRVLSRSSLQHEVIKYSEPRDMSAQPSTELNQCGVDGSGQDGKAYDEHYLDLPSHIRDSVYGDNSQGQQVWVQEAMNAIAQVQISELEYEGMMEAEPDYDFEVEQVRYDEQFVPGQRDQHEHPYYRENVQLGKPRIRDAAIDFGQTLPEPDPMNQYFQTPRGRSYFRPRSFEIPNLQDDAHEVSLLEDDQLKGFWATKKW